MAVYLVTSDNETDSENDFREEEIRKIGGKKRRIESSSESGSGLDENTGSDSDGWDIIDKSVRFPNDNLGRSKNLETNTPNNAESGGNGSKREEIGSKEKNLHNNLSFESSRTPPEKVRQIEQSIISAFQRVLPKRRILHDIYDRCLSPGGDRIVNKSLGRSYPGSIYIVVAHDNHWHVIHDCQYSSSTCRCTRIDIWKSDQQRYNRRIIHTTKFTIRHWYNLAIYLQKGTRQVHCFQIGGRDWIKRNQIGGNPFQGCSGVGPVELVESGHLPIGIFEFVECRSDQHQNNGTAETGREQIIESKINKGSKGDRLKKFVADIPTSPLSHITSTPFWTASKWRYMPKIINYY